MKENWVIFAEKGNFCTCYIYIYVGVSRSRYKNPIMNYETITIVELTVAHIGDPKNRSECHRRQTPWENGGTLGICK